MTSRRILLTRGVPLLTASTLLKLDLICRASTGGGGKKALICLYLPGGMDSMNMLVPLSLNGTALHDTYTNIRTSLALMSSEWARLGTSRFGLHTNLPSLKDAFEAGNSPTTSRRASFICGVAPMVARRSGTHLGASGEVPQGLQSHSDQTLQWQTSVPRNSETAGWAGRMTDLIQSNACNTELYTLSTSQVMVNGRVASPLNAASLFSTNSGSAENSSASLESIHNAMKGRNAAGAVVDAGRAANYAAWDSAVRAHAQSVAGTRTVPRDGYSDPLATHSLLEQAMAARLVQALDRGDYFQGVFDQALTGPAPATELDNQLHRALQIIRNRFATGTPDSPDRIIVFVSTPFGWDHHYQMKSGLNANLIQLNTSIEKFYQWSGAPELRDKVVLFSASEFGRTLTPNASAGSDHAWSGIQFICGHTQSGLRSIIAGQHPLATGIVESGGSSLSINELNFGEGAAIVRGVMSPVLSTDDYFRDLARWFGLSNNEIGAVLPAMAPGGRLHDGGLMISNGTEIPVIGSGLEASFGLFA